MNYILVVFQLMLLSFLQEPAAYADSGAQSCIVSEAALKDLAQKQAELAEREKLFQEKESAFKVKEEALQGEIQKLDELKKSLAGAQELAQRQNEEKIARLVETFEKMSPKGAASILAEVEEGLAVSAMQRISTLKLAKILNSMDGKKASALTEAIADVRRSAGAKNSNARDLASKGAIAESQAKGGENNDGKHKR